MFRSYEIQGDFRCKISAKEAIFPLIPAPFIFFEASTSHLHLVRFHPCQKIKTLTNISHRVNLSLGQIFSPSFYFHSIKDQITPLLLPLPLLLPSLLFEAGCHLAKQKQRRQKMAFLVGLMVLPFDPKLQPLLCHPDFRNHVSTHFHGPAHLYRSL